MKRAIKHILISALVGFAIGYFFLSTLPYNLYEGDETVYSAMKVFIGVSLGNNVCNSYISLLHG